MSKLISPLQTIESSKTKNKNLTLTLDEILERKGVEATWRESEKREWGFRGYTIEGVSRWQGWV